MTKGRGDASMKCGGWAEGVFQHLGWAERPMIPLSKNISRNVRGTAGPSTSLSSGRDDKFVGSERLNCRSLGCARDDKFVGSEGLNCRSLGCARDDKGEG